MLTRLGLALPFRAVPQRATSAHGWAPAHHDSGEGHGLPRIQLRRKPSIGPRSKSSLLSFLKRIRYTRLGMSSELAVAVQRRNARLVSCDGSEEQVELFLHSTSSRGPRPETVLERLNALEGEFLPCEVQGRVVLFNLLWIAYVECPSEVRPDLGESEKRLKVEFDLVSGETLHGELPYVARPGRARVSDLLNSTGDRFLRLVTGSMDRYVRREAILRVRL